MTLPASLGTDQTLAICIAGLAEALIAQEKEIVTLLKRSIAFHLAEYTGDFGVPVFGSTEAA